MIRKLKPKSEFSRNVLTLMTGTTIAQAIPIAISPILTRIYTPEDFGLYALFLATVSIFGTIATARYEQAIMLPAKDEDAINIFALGLIINFFISLCLFILIIIYHEYVLKIFNKSEIGFWLYIVPIVVFLTGLYNLLYYYNNRKKYYKDMATVTVIKSIAVVIIQLIMGFLKFGVVGLISGQIVSQLFGNLKLLKNISRDKVVLNIEKHSILLLSKRYKNFPKFQMPHALLNVLSSKIPIFIFSSFFSLSIVGFYSLALKVLFTPLLIVSSASATVYNQTLSELYNSREDCYAFTIRFLVSILKKIIIPFILIVLMAPDLFELIFGKDWREAGVYAQILSPYILLNVLVSSISFIASLLNMQRKAFIVSIIHFILISIALIVGIAFDSIYFSLVAYTIAMLIILMYNLSWMLKELKKVNNVNKKNM